MFKVFVEGYEMKCARVQVETGIGPLSAQIVIPPGENRRKILPGSRVLCIVKEGEEWYEWFQGTTTNMPETSLGFDENPVTLNIISDLGLLQSILMSYFTLGQVDTRNYASKSPTWNGRPLMFRAGLGPMLFTFSQAMTNRSVNFGDRVVGIIQALVSLDPQGWEDLRRLQYLDRLAIEMADDIADALDQRIVLQSISETIGSIQSESFTALDVLNIILQMSMHELVSIAPVRHSGGASLKKVKRHSNYMPFGMTLSDLADLDQKTMVDKMCTRESSNSMQIDHFIKPVDRFHVPAKNVITKKMYNNAYITDNGFTRAIIRVPYIQNNQTHMVSERVMPPQLQMASDSITAATLRSDKSPSLGAVSSVMSERASGLRTNKEKIYGGVRVANIQVEPRTYSMMSALAALEKKDKKTQQEYQKEYEDAWVRYEYEKINGASVTITGATLNFDIIPGFGISVQDSNGHFYTGKLVKKVDVIDLESQHASSTYMISSCKADKSLDYDGPVSFDLPMPYWFQETGVTHTSYTSPLFAKYSNEGTNRQLEAALSDFVTYERALAMNHLKETSPTVLEPEDRFEIKDNLVYMVQGSSVPLISIRKEFETEAFYSNFDLLTEIASRKIEKSSPNAYRLSEAAIQAEATKRADAEILNLRNDNTLLTTGDIEKIRADALAEVQVEEKKKEDEGYNTQYKAIDEFLPPLAMSTKEAVSVLDTKNGTIFSVLAKTIGDEVIKRAAAVRVEEEIQKIRTESAGPVLLTTGDVESMTATATQDIADAENERVSGRNSELNKMFNQYNPNFPIYLGNPSPLRVEMLLHFMSRLKGNDLTGFLENGTMNKLNDEGIPRPMSDYQVIAMRRDIARKASNE